MFITDTSRYKVELRYPGFRLKVLVDFEKPLFSINIQRETLELYVPEYEKVLREIRDLEQEINKHWKKLKNVLSRLLTHL